MRPWALYALIHITLGCFLQGCPEENDLRDILRDIQALGERANARVEDQDEVVCDIEVAVACLSRIAEQVQLVGEAKELLEDIVSALADVCDDDLERAHDAILEALEAAAPILKLEEVDPQLHEALEALSALEATLGMDERWERKLNKILEALRAWGDANLSNEEGGVSDLVMAVIVELESFCGEEPDEEDLLDEAHEAVQAAIEEANMDVPGEGSLNLDEIPALKHLAEFADVLSKDEQEEDWQKELRNILQELQSETDMRMQSDDNPWIVDRLRSVVIALEEFYGEEDDGDEAVDVALKVIHEALEEAMPLMQGNDTPPEVRRPLEYLEALEHKMCEGNKDGKWQDILEEILGELRSWYDARVDEDGIENDYVADKVQGVIIELEEFCRQEEQETDTKMDEKTRMKREKKCRMKRLSTPI